MMNDLGNKSEVVEVLTSLFPNSKIISIQKINVGITRQTYVVKISNGIEKIEYIVQSYHNNSRNDKTLREYHNLTFLRQHLDEVSKDVYTIESRSKILYIIKQRLEGNIVLAPKNIEEYCQKLAQITYKIHQIPLNTDLKSRLPTVVDKIEEFRTFTWKNIRLNQFDKMLQALKSYDYSSQEQVLNHGDLWMGNFLWKENQVSGIIDWEDARIGTRYYDLGIARFELFLAFGMIGLDLFTEEYSRLYGPLNRQLLNKYDLAALFRVVGGISGWTELWNEFNRPDVNKELFYTRIDGFYEMVEEYFYSK